MNGGVHFKIFLTIFIIFLISFITVIIWIPTYGLSKWYKSIKKENFQKVSYSEISPQIHQVMSHSQIKSISEAYNRKLYDDISKQ